jgi:hypothetical protein
MLEWLWKRKEAPDPETPEIVKEVPKAEVPKEVPKAEGLTEYRIVTDNSHVFIGHRFLQFKLAEGDWRFIPDDCLGYVLDRDFRKEAAPKSSAWEICLVDAFSSEYDHKLTTFAKLHPRIDEYFAALQIKHDEHVREQKRRASAPTTYLNEGKA